MVVYGDLLFLINFSMDFLCFYISCLLLHQKLPVFRAFAASCLGGIYSVAALFVSVGGLKATLIDVGALLLMCFTVYLGKDVTFGRILKGIFLYFFVSALLGGLMTALFSLFNRIELLAVDSGITEEINVWIFALLAVIGSILTLKGSRLFKSSSAKRVARLLIEGDLGSAEFRALVDSGNLAIEPISGRAVVFVSIEKCKNIIENDLYNLVNKNSNIDELSLDVLSKIRMIPTRVVLGETLLVAKRFNKVSVQIGKLKKDIDVYVAFVKDGYLGEYDAVISDETII